jgi:hypothetical protein
MRSLPSRHDIRIFKSDHRSSGEENEIITKHEGLVRSPVPSLSHGVCDTRSGELDRRCAVVSGKPVYQPDLLYSAEMLCRTVMPFWLVLCCSLSPGATGSFQIRPAGAIQMEVRYYLTGGFGGYGGFVRDGDEAGSYRIPLFVDPHTERAGENGTPAENLKAILYTPGCQFSLLSVNLTATLTRNATFNCRPLPNTTLTGRISPPLADPKQVDVEILYVASWDHSFFGIGDGAVQQFEVAKTPLDARGRFQLQIPDFSEDIVTTQMQNAYLAVLVVQHSGGNLVQTVLPSTELLYRNVGLKILPHYDSEISFTRR